MEIGHIEHCLKSGVPLGSAERQFVRDLISAGPSKAADRATDLLYFHPEECGVTTQDRKLLERSADGAISRHTRALALSVLCNWLSLATSQVDRILTALAAPSYEEDDFLCIKACGCAALALECAWEPRLARALVEVFHDETRLIGTRESAQNALLRVDGLSSREIVAAERTNRRALRERAEAVAERLRARASAAT